MRKTKRRQLSFYSIAFLVLALLFLALGLGTLGSTVSTGKSFELLAAQSESGDAESIVLQISNPTEKDETGKSVTVYTRVHDVYFHIGAIYSEPDQDVSFYFTRSSSYSTFSTSSTYRYTAKLQNQLPSSEDSDAIVNSQGNWITPFTAKFSASTYRTSSYSYYKLQLSSRNNLMIDEIVFVGEKLTSSSGTGTGEYCVIPVKIYSATPYNGESNEEAVARAGALIDAQQLPNTAQSSFNVLSSEEVAVLANISQMRLGNVYSKGSVYTGDGTYNTMGTSILALGTLIFGTSPFGLRFFPMLASFGVLVLAFFLAKRLFKSERAGFACALVYALCNFSFGLGHLGTPLMLGVFFFLASLYFCLGFYLRGMKGSRFIDALPLMLSGLFGAAAICVNGAFLIPVLGVVGVFAAGFVRQQKARRYYLDEAIAEFEAEEAELQKEYRLKESEKPEPEAKKKVAKVAGEYAEKNRVALAAFLASFVLGTFCLTFLFLIPAYHLAVKLFDNPESPALNAFVLAAKFFAGGFVGGTEASAWAIPYTLFHGTGEGFYAITSLVMNVFAALAGLLGIAFAIWRIVAVLTKREGAKKSELRTAVVSLAGVVLCLVTAAFAQGALAFLMLSYVFAFVLAGGAVHFFLQKEGKLHTAAVAVSIVGIVLLAAFFLLCAVFTFSLPLPASFMQIFG